MGEVFHKNVTLLPGDCLAVLPSFVGNSLDSCVTDPPYGLSFMGKAWDRGVPGAEFWKHVLRVLKPGAHLLAFGGTRTYHRMACAIEDAGFELRDCIQWIYGSGFPKSLNVSKAIDEAAGAERRVIGKRPATDAAREWQGWGTALKPACEMIVLARKPLSERTVVANVLRWGTGALNIDGCRVGDYVQHSGRWPANVIHDGSDEVAGAFPDAPGQQRSTGPEFKSKRNVYGVYAETVAHEPRGDSGSASRFFYGAKADADDRLGSKHPTVKPLDLMQYLVRLVTPPKGVVLDCFAGTGTTGEAARREGFRAVLIEREPEYQNDIRRRMRLAMAGPAERRRESIKAKNAASTNSGPLFEPVVTHG
jgi:DNA modification methylase